MSVKGSLSVWFFYVVWGKVMSIIVSMRMIIVIRRNMIIRRIIWWQRWLDRFVLDISTHRLFSIKVENYGEREKNSLLSQFHDVSVVNFRAPNYWAKLLKASNRHPINKERKNPKYWHLTSKTWIIHSLSSGRIITTVTVSLYFNLFCI